MKHNVHLYAVVRVRLDDIEAEDAHAAIGAAIEEFESRPAYHLQYSRSVEYDDELVGTLVDWQDDNQLKSATFSEFETKMARR